MKTNKISVIVTLEFEEALNVTDDEALDLTENAFTGADSESLLYCVRGSTDPRVWIAPKRVYVAEKLIIGKED